MALLSWDLNYIHFLHKNTFGLYRHLQTCTRDPRWTDWFPNRQCNPVGFSFPLQEGFGENCNLLRAICRHLCMYVQKRDLEGCSMSLSWQDKLIWSSLSNMGVRKRLNSHSVSINVNPFYNVHGDYSNNYVLQTWLTYLLERCQKPWRTTEQHLQTQLI